MRTGIAGRIAQAFLDSKLTPLLMIAFLGLGIYGTSLTPREEEPQINAPMADIFIGYPGASPKEVEKRVSIPMERLLTNIEGVKDVYSTSMPGKGMISAQFAVGEDQERSLVKLYNEIYKHMDQMPSGVSQPMVKTRSIDDVPQMTLTLWSKSRNDYELRRVAEELELEVKQVQDVAETKIHGGRSRQVKVLLDKTKMAAYNLDPLQIAQQVKQANHKINAGSFNQSDRQFLVETGNFFKSADEIANLVVDVRDGSPIYLKSVADVSDGPEEPASYVSYGVGQKEADKYNTKAGQAFPAVTISVAKRPGTDAMRIAERINRKVDNLDKVLIPSDINVSTTRNYGESASHKVASLLEHLLGAILAVTLVVAIGLGWRGGLVVFLSVPITFALTLFLYYMFGYTLNRITLFALIFVTGIVVDDSIIIAENMHRHFKMRQLPFKQAAIASISEVGNPTILATLTVIAAVLPMAFVSGLMGPYMSPMPIGASLAMIFSLLVALTITPYLAYRILPYATKKEPEDSDTEYRLEDTWIFSIYRKTMQPLLESVKLRWLFIGGTTVLLLASMLLFYFRMVEVKMLPFDNKNEMQIMVDMPEGTTLERTNAVAREVGMTLKNRPQVTDYQIYSGTNAPINFNGLVRHYDLREDANTADIQVNLTPKGQRSIQSHSLAKEIRPLVKAVARRHDANIKVVEVPPGPPVMSTLVAEIYGPEKDRQREIGRKVKKMFNNMEGVVDVDWKEPAAQTEYKFEINREKAMLSGVPPRRLVKVMNMALDGRDVSKVYKSEELKTVPVHLQLPEPDRSGVEALKSIHVESRAGKMVAVGDLVTVSKARQDRTIHRKNQRRVTYVTANVAGKIESPVYAILDAGEKIGNIKLPAGYDLSQLYTQQPFMQEDYTLKWDGEWQITYEVFRDLGIAFAVVLLVIYLLIVGWFQDFKVPIIMMIAIPLSLVGILFFHWIYGAFFTATSMIGMIALAGIMVRNSVLLIDFINIRLAEGISLKQSVIEAGAVRTTPILLTAGTVIIGALVIVLDPIFQGLAISLIGGAVASTALTLLIVPLIYFMTEKHKIGNNSGEDDQST
jgi:multidrug efflux pump subunit AcrB